jgi:signal transduction histidine kinase
MKRKHSLFYLVTAFVLAQLAWFALLGLWIYWYVANYLIFEQVGDQLSPQLAIDSPNVLIFVLGIILLVGIEIAMVLTFRNLTVQMKITSLYDNFIGNVSHELKSPLSSIQLFLETLSTKEVSNEKRLEFYNLMHKDADRLKKLINSILEISRLEQKRIAHNYHIYNAEKIIKELVHNSIVQFRIPEDSVRVEGSSDERCVIDKEAMQIVFDNIMNNSIKYSPDKADITVRLSNEQKYLKIEFCDKGIGLGLYWAKEIIKFHGGKISVFSEGIGKGTIITIKLPIYQTAKTSYVNSLLKRTVKNRKVLESSYGE